MDEFEYTYSAPEQEEICRIREKYVPRHILPMNGSQKGSGRKSFRRFWHLRRVWKDKRRIEGTLELGSLMKIGLPRLFLYKRIRHCILKQGVL